MKPLFIPLKGEYFDAFVNGDKFFEYRLYGARWNLETCKMKRQVVLSRGYGAKFRADGYIREVHVVRLHSFGADFRERAREMFKLPPGDDPKVICIGIELTHYLGVPL